MRLTRQSEIAIGALAICARKPERIVSTRQVAEQAGTTKDHAAQIVAVLVRNGYLASERGRAGGLRLAVDPKSVTLGDVLRLTQPELAGEHDAHDRNRPSGTAALDTIVDAATASFVRLMDRFTVADLVAAPATGRMACLDCELMNPALRPRSSIPLRSQPHPPFLLHAAARKAAMRRRERPDTERPDRHALLLHR